MAGSNILSYDGRQVIFKWSNIISEARSAGQNMLQGFHYDWSFNLERGDRAKSGFAVCEPVIHMARSLAWRDGPSGINST